MKFIKFLFVCFLSPFTVAQDHLYPLEKMYYDEAFEPAYSMYVDLKVIISPPFSPASVLYISEEENKSSLVYLKLSPTQDKNKPFIGEEKCNIPIQISLAKKLEKIWKNELYKTRYPKKNQTTRDGTFYDFSVPARTYRTENGWDSQPKMLGYAWSPKSESRMGAFVILVNSLKEFCLASSNLDSLNKAMDKLVVK